MSLRWSLNDGVYEVTLAAPPCNEIGSRMLAELERVVKEIDPSRARALILHSDLDSGFCAGADLRELFAAATQGDGRRRKGELQAFLERIHAVMNALDALPLTTIGAIHGICFGGGFELALTCDLLVADATARFCFPELRLGLIPGFGGIPRLKREVGNALIRDLLLTGRSINAMKAGAVGLVSQVVATGQALEVARTVAKRANDFDAEAANCAKAFVKQVPLEALEEEKALFLRLFDSPVVIEALRKFVESDDVRPYV